MALRRPQKSFWLLCILIFHQPLFASLLIYSSNFNGSIIFIIKCSGLAFSLMPCWDIQESFSICTELRETHFFLISVSNLRYPAVPLLSFVFLILYFGPICDFVSKKENSSVVHHPFSKIFSLASSLISGHNAWMSWKDGKVKQLKLKDTNNALVSSLSGIFLTMASCYDVLENCLLLWTWGILVLLMLF